MPRKEGKPGEPLYYRRRAGLTLKDVQADTDISFTMLSRLENGRGNNPNIRTLWTLAELYAPHLRVKPGGIFLAMAEHLYQQQLEDEKEDKSKKKTKHKK